ncbi:transketolase family protein [Desulfobacula toluolica]|uniref:Transketolase, pyrimidine-binding domain protein n=1 Tax=Desulfobacula toluolica (strain DSM 7467 / Tol2) TaxID=651182 RepID=K0NBI3_DESTT|nr:transketolase, pyrimidine-binding domain-containing protein [Desulfobacula toluolica]CCK81674.1 transketolase, pyrimidine-binding domain protein [Desulfobacula toluolica Tol2]
MNDNNYRKEIINAMLEHVGKDARIMLLVGDMGFGVVDNFKKEFPGRIFNCGMMEQGMVGIAAGMAMAGLKPVVYCIVNFLAFRAIEQIRNDVIMQDLNVKFIATGVNDYFKFLGDSHCCGQDDKVIMKLIGMPVFDPYVEDCDDFSGMVDSWMSSEQAGYIRV